MKDMKFRKGKYQNISHTRLRWSFVVAGKNTEIREKSYCYRFHHEGQEGQEGKIKQLQKIFDFDSPFA